MDNSIVISSKPRERIYGLDLLRIVSMLMVLFLHVLGQGGILSILDKSTTQYKFAWLIEIAAYCAVNCYALISGYVGIKSRFKYSNIAFLWLQVFFYTTLITLIYSIVNPSVVTGNHYWAAIFPVMKRAYWYFTSYFCIFFFIPAFNHVINTMPKKQVRAMMICIVLFFSVMYTLARAGVFGNAIDDLFVTSKGYSPLWLALLYIIGAYISKYREDFKIPPIICFACYVVAVFLTWLEKLVASKSVLVGYTSPTVLICGVALLIGFSQLKLNRISKIIAFLSPLSFSVYLIHVHPLVWTNFMKNRFADFASYPTWRLITAVVLAVVCLYSICSAIDIVRHYLFKLLHIKSGLEKIEKKICKDLWH